MRELLQVMILGILAVVFITVLKKHCPELSILLIIVSTLILGIFFLHLFQPILSFAEELHQLSGLDSALLDPVFKSLGIGMLSQISVNACSDAGQSGIGKMIQVCGCVMCLYVSLPLFRGILSLIGGG